VLFRSNAQKPLLLGRHLIHKQHSNSASCGEQGAINVPILLAVRYQYIVSTNVRLT